MNLAGNNEEEEEEEEEGHSGQVRPCLADGWTEARWDAASSAVRYFLKFCINKRSINPFLLTAGVLYIEDCQHFGCTVHHTMMYSASFMMHYDAQCDFGNLKHWQIFKMHKIWFGRFFFPFYYMNDALCVIVRHI